MREPYRIEVRGPCKGCQDLAERWHRGRSRSYSGPSWTGGSGFISTPGRAIVLLSCCRYETRPWPTTSEFLFHYRVNERRHFSAFQHRTLALSLSRWICVRRIGFGSTYYGLRNACVRRGGSQQTFDCHCELYKPMAMVKYPGRVDHTRPSPYPHGPALSQAVGPASSAGLV